MSLSIPSSVESLENIKNHIVRTPLLFSERLSNEINSKILFLPPIKKVKVKNKKLKLEGVRFIEQ